MGPHFNYHSKKNSCGGISMRSIRRTTLSFLAVAALVTLSTQAFSASVAVGTCTSLVNFATIQQAVNASSSAPGTIIKVCPGTYHEQVLITTLLTLEGISNATRDAVVIAPPVGGVVENGTVDPRGPVAAQILVQNTAGPVVITNLTVDGTGNQYTGSGDLRGICYQDASGTVNHVAVRNEIPNDVPTGVQSGQGILVETISSSSAALTVENSSVHNYNKNGIVARYAGASLTATGNYVQGSGPTSIIAQNGIELAFNGATGSIKSNTVIDNFYTPTDSSAADILLYDAAENGGIAVSSNILGNSNYAISLYTDTAGTYGDGVSVTSNKIFGTSTFDAIDVCTNGNTITSNTIFNSYESGIHLDASCGATGVNNTVSKNTILESECAGILDDSNGVGNTIGPDTFYTVPFTVTASTSKCTFSSAATAFAKAKAGHKLRPAI
jgi:parallel beta-helix repeat protein